MIPSVQLLKLPDPSAQTAKYVNMMNMTKQQEVAERQSALAQQQIANAQADEARKAALQPSALGKAEADAGVAEIKLVMDFYNASANDIANATSPEQAVARGQRLKQQFANPVLQARIDETIGELTADPSKFEENRKRILLRTLSAKDQYAITHSNLFDANGNLLNIETSPIGASPTRITPGVVTDLPSVGGQPVGGQSPRTPVPNAAPQTPTGADMRATQGSATTPQDLRDQGMDPAFIPSGSPVSRPISFNQSNMALPTAGQMSQDMVPAILDSAVKTGVMAQIDLDQIIAMAPPQAKQAIMDVIRSNNIALQADAPSLAFSGMGQQQPMANPVQTPQSQFANLPSQPMPNSNAGMRGAPPFEQTLAQYQVGQQIKGRNPNISPAPAESPQQAGDRAREIRQTPAEAAAITAAIEKTKAGIQRDARLAEETRTRTKGRKLFSAALADMRKDYDTLNKLRAIPSTERPMLDNFGDYLGSSYLGRKVQSAAGTKASVALNNIANSRLTLLNALKEVTNMSAAQLSSNVELMTFLDSLADPTQGYESAVETIRRLENLYGMPAQGPRRTPVVASGWGKVEVEPN
jgi:hypothetical protein